MSLCPGLCHRIASFAALILCLWTAPGAANDHYLWLSTTLNQAAKGDILAVQDVGNGQLLAETAQLQQWGILHKRSSVVRLLEDVSFSVLDSIEGLSYRLDEEQAQLHIDIDPQALPTHYIVADSKPISALQRGRGFHLNYDNLLQHSNSDYYLGSVLEPVWHGQWGFIRNRQRLRYDSLQQSFDSLRLDTVLSHDWVAESVRFNVGDIISASDSFGHRYRLGGVQIHREFSIRPQQRNFPTPFIGGLAALPSDVELFINGTRQAGFSTPPGPFELRNPPVMTGAGTAELVLTNALGEQIVQSLNFYIDPKLLRTGLLDFDLALGWQRQDFGQHSNHYQNFSGHGSVRYGFNEKITLNASAITSPALNNAEIGSLFQLGNLPLSVGLGLGAWQLNSHSEGVLGRASLDFRKGDWFAGIQGIVSEAAEDIDALPLQSQWLARAGRRWGHWNIHLDNLYRKRNAQDRFSRQNVRVSRSWQLSNGHWSLSAGIFRSQDSQGVSDGGGLLYLRFAPDRQQALSVSSGPDQRWATQYRHQSREQLGHRFQAEYIHQNDFSLRSLQWQQSMQTLQWRAQAQDYRSQSAFSLGMSGALGRMSSDRGNHWFAARHLGEAYALVDLAGLEDMPVYLHNRVVTHSDKRGIAVLPRLRPYESNPVSINPLDLPLAAQVEQTDFDLMPGRGSGLSLSMPISQGRAAQLRLLQRPGIPVPEGAIIRQPDDHKRFYVGQDGQAYVDGLHRDKTEYRAYWQDQQCAFTIPMQRLADELMPHIGAIRCE